MRIAKHLAFGGLLACLAAGVALPGAANAQKIAGAPFGAFDASAKRATVLAAAKVLSDEYVDAQTGAQAAAMLTHNLDAGAYDTAATPGDLAARLTQDLQALTHDKHLVVIAAGQPIAGAPVEPPPPLGLFGFTQADRLQGNVGYIVLNSFGFAKDGFRQGADKAMALVASTDALIIDLRNNDGGEPASEAYLASFFFDDKTPVDIDAILWRKPGTTEFDRQVFATEPTPVRYADKPVYVITGPRTFSAGEALAYDLQALKRATVVGSVTAGGAHPRAVRPIGPGLMISIPKGRGDNPVTRTDWEGTGVTPDIAVSVDQGFAAAYGAALKVLGRPVIAGASADAVTEVHTPLHQRATPAPGSEDALRRWEAGMAQGQPPFDILGDNAAKDARAFLPFFQQQLSQRGALQNLAFVAVDAAGADIYDATFADKSVLRFTIVMGPDGRIVSCMFGPR